MSVFSEAFDGVTTGTDNRELTTKIMAKLKITQVRGVVGKPKRQRRTMEALGLRGRHKTVVQDDTPAIRGMLNKVPHLVEVEEVDE